MNSCVVNFTCGLMDSLSHGQGILGEAGDAKVCRGREIRCVPGTQKGSMPHGDMAISGKIYVDITRELFTGISWVGVTVAANLPSVHNPSYKKIIQESSKFLS